MFGDSIRKPSPYATHSLTLALFGIYHCVWPRIKMNRERSEWNKTKNEPKRMEASSRRRGTNKKDRNAHVTNFKLGDRAKEMAGRPAKRLLEKEEWNGLPVISATILLPSVNWLALCTALAIWSSVRFGRSFPHLMDWNAENSDAHAHFTVCHRFVHYTLLGDSSVHRGVRVCVFVAFQNQKTIDDKEIERPKRS